MKEKEFKKNILGCVNNIIAPVIYGFVIGRGIGCLITHQSMLKWEFYTYIVIYIALAICHALYNNAQKKICDTTIDIKYHNPNTDKISKFELGDWIDLRAAETVEMKKGDFKLISLGVSIKLPEGYEAHVVPRSSTFKNWGILQANSIGIIDNSYSGDNDIWMFPAYAIRNTTIKENERICQFRIVKKQPDVHFVEKDKLDDNNRGGFGSTGKS